VPGPIAAPNPSRRSPRLPVPAAAAAARPASWSTTRWRWRPGATDTRAGWPPDP